MAGDFLEEVEVHVWMGLTGDVSKFPGEFGGDHRPDSPSLQQRLPYLAPSFLPPFSPEVHVELVDLGVDLGEGFDCRRFLCE